MTVQLKAQQTSLISGLVIPSGDYSDIGNAIVALAVALTEFKIADESVWRSYDLQKTLKSARDFASYRMIENGWAFEDDNLFISLTFNEDYKARTSPRIFVDSDGVVASFDKQVLNITGKTIAELGDDRMWELVGNNETFWRTMPLMPGAERLWEAVKPLGPSVLTGCPKTAYGLSSALKKAWWKGKFDHDDVITCLSRDKALFCAVKGDVLIDDFYHNIKRWRAAGGIGILHKSVDNTIDELRNLHII